MFGLFKRLFYYNEKQVTCTESTGKHLLVAAFDFGTTLSGYAFSFRNDPTKIQTNQAWIAGSESLLSLKTPTCVLLNPHNECAAFGFEAENKYLNLVVQGEHKSWMLFRRFKMLLHNNDGLNRKATVEDITGKKMPAMKIFAMSIRYLRDHLVDALHKQVDAIQESDILYVITVPAIWNDAAKRFMREAALEAGLDNDRIKLALEPEAASIWCQNINTSIKTDLSKAGIQYMVVDLGGGTADISVHEKNLDGTLKEIHKASGGPWGGILVDRNFICWLTNIFGQAKMSKLREEDMEDYISLLRQFENKKRTITQDTDGLITFRLPISLINIHDEAEKLTVNKKFEQMKIPNALINDKLRVPANIVRSWFSESIEETIRRMTNLLSDSKMMNVSTILLVGGFGECKLVHDSVKREFRNKRIIVPQEAGLAVLKGAVRFGHWPGLVTSRIVKYTYEFSSMSDYDANIHGIEKRVTLDCYGDEKVENRFLKIVSVNTEVNIGKPIKAPGYTYLQINCDCVMAIYTSLEPNPVFVTDSECKKIGEIPLGYAKGKSKDENRIEVSFLFGDSELEVRVKILKDGSEIKKVIDFFDA
ncbi:heat shock 70 kDa protein 12B-like [Mya arenaria]|uniref:heat shock 70 kDa protein 12B-like n=1 Tax=Mya arenaria TaxID=6604 RepID=UPI0022E0451C|nr:heat shock 70 kDa protein 12B-like [Mya arenaria]XP_052816868.1 heat shock 70 kDa protein 12B-like [Mya arenaria]XP_052816869.1 heat shock 70 kDa protein 12B-like [Mya arenaria]XP_052816870.1 heat shock 70 kDa protein 12B-like [Mya arenaria]XP_052816871.1 heat shock 70 kDa protein 12B-like [Mya arenaria]